MGKKWINFTDKEKKDSVIAHRERMKDHRAVLGLVVRDEQDVILSEKAAQATAAALAKKDADDEE